MEASYETYNPTCSSKLRYCCGKKFWPRLRMDLWSYWHVHYMDLFFNIMTTTWLLTGTILFGVASKTNNPKVWTWLGVISAAVPFGLWLMIGLIGILLYCRKVYLESSDELLREVNPGIYACDSFRIDEPIILDVVTDSKIIRI